MRSAFECGFMTAGRSALRGSGPGQFPAFENAVAHVGCPGRRIDRLCITCCSPSQPSQSRHGARRDLVRPLARLDNCIARPWPSLPKPFGRVIGKGDGSDFGRPSCQQCCDPGPMLSAMEFGIADDGECARHEQATQIAVPLFADTAEPGPTPPIECCLGTSPIQPRSAT
jgi:hypothetical protein